MEKALGSAVEARIFAVAGHHKRHDVKLAVSAFSGCESDLFPVGREDGQDILGVAVSQAFEAGSFGVDEIEFKVFAVVAVGAEKNPFFRRMPEGCPVDTRFEGQLADIAECCVLQVGHKDLGIAFGVKRAPCHGFSAGGEEGATIVAFAPSEAALGCAIRIHQVKLLVAVAVGAKDDVLSIGAVGSFGIVAVGVGQASGIFAIEISKIDLVGFVDPSVGSFVFCAAFFSPFLGLGSLFALCAVLGDPRGSKKTEAVRFSDFIDGRGVKDTLSVWMEIRTCIIAVMVGKARFFSILEVKDVDLCMGVFFSSVGLKDQFFSIR